jgi:hypothetical protein
MKFMLNFPTKKFNQYAFMYILILLSLGTLAWVLGLNIKDFFQGEPQNFSNLTNIGKILTGAVPFSLILIILIAIGDVGMSNTKPNKAVTAAHNEFESSIDKIARKRDSRVTMDFLTTANGVYQDPRTRRAFAHFNTSPAHERSSDDFLLSLMVGYATDSPIMGYAAGGSLLGGMVGAGIHDNHNSSSHHVSTSHDYSPRVETPETMLGSSSISYSNSCRASDYPSSSSDSGSSSSYSSSDSGSSSSDSGSSDSSSSD